MATYYVRPASDGGSDVAAGTAIGTAWATIDKAANTVAAGDTVWIKPAVYRELVTMDTAGSSGSSITYNGDFDGTKFGTVGPVIISAWDDDTSTPVRACCWEMNGKGFIVVNKIQFMGGTTFAVGNTAFVSATAYEGCEFNDCVIQRSGNDYAIRLELNAGVTPTANGLIIRRCALLGGVRIEWDSQATAMVNLKWVFERCLAIQGVTAPSGIGFVRVTNGGANTVGGVTIRHCSFIGCSDGVTLGSFANTTNPTYIYSCLFGYGSVGVEATTATAAAVVAYNNTFAAVNSPYNGGTQLPDTDRQDVPAMLGGIHDALYYQTYGWSPYKPWEPLKISGIYTDPSIDYGTLDSAGGNDIYGQGAMGRPSVYSHIYYFDGSDAAVSDPQAVWTNEANVTDTLQSSLATVNTTGSTASNYVMAEGTNAPSSGATIATVYVRMLHKWGSSNGANAGELKVYSDALGELLATVANSVTGTTATWTTWAALTTPSGGWTWAKVQALEFKAYRTAGATTFQIAQIQTYVATAENAPDAGIVEANTQPIQNSTDQYEGTYCVELSGAGSFQFWQPVAAASTTITVRAKYDSNYTGTKPLLVVTNIPGVADQTATVAGASGSYELLSLNFTPTSSGFVRVKFVSSDTSATGKAFFDDLQVS